MEARLLTDIPSAISFTSISGCFYHVCGLQTNGVARCWGRNDTGQLSPPMGETLLAVSAGSSFTCGLTTRSTIRCFGGFSESPLPGKWISLSSGSSHVCALSADGTARCAGNNAYGQTSVPNLLFSQISAGATHSCGLIAATRRSICFGTDSYGESSFVQGQHLEIASVFAFFLATCAVLQDRSLSCGGGIDFTVTPPKLPPLSGLSMVTSGAYHNCGLRASDGYAVCFGVSFGGRTSAPLVKFRPLAAGDATPPPSDLQSRV